jgi:hypothetical protein
MPRNVHAGRDVKMAGTAVLPLTCDGQSARRHGAADTPDDGVEDCPPRLTQQSLSWPCLRPDAQDPRLIFRRHRVNGVHDQVEQHLLDLDLISSYLWKLHIRLGLHDDSVLVEVGTSKREGFLDQIVEVE